MLAELVKKIENNLKESMSNNIPLKTKSAIFLNFKETRLANFGGIMAGDIKLLQKRLNELPSNEKTLDARRLAEQLAAELGKEDKAAMLKTLGTIKQSLPETNQKKEDHSLRIQNIPDDVKSDIELDLKEIKKCYDAECYRSAVILCGRLLETALHRKYYETTGVDILEKSPGIGLGNLIAKLNEKGIELDPGLTQQIHLVNQVRIFSVHKKQKSFSPTKAQTSAIILFTTDTLEKLFSKT